jgi:P4 family phage/plasmid primase-like protien
MSSQKQQTLTDFLIKHNAKDESNKTNIKSTHNRMGDKSANIFAGSYVIPKEERTEFYALYYNHVFVQNKLEYLTERQIEDGLENSGPILIDFDFHYDYAVTERQHDKQFIMDIITSLYLEELKEFFIFDENSRFDIFVMEKPHVNRVKDKNITKDGIHIVMCVQMDHTMQLMLRDRIVKKFPDYSELPLINEIDKVFDLGISQGAVGWQLYGSRKPGHDAYRITSYFKASYDKEDSIFNLCESPITEFNLDKNFHKICAQYEGNPKFQINPQIAAEYNEKSKKNMKKKSGGSSSSKKKANLIIDDDDDDSEIVLLEDIVDSETLSRAMNQILDILHKTNTANDYAIIEAHEFTQILPAKYYEPGSHYLNRQVAFALKSTSEKLFLSWIMLRSKADDFDYSTIIPLYQKWKQFNKSSNADGTGGVTKRSLLYWARQDAPEEYLRVKNTTIDNFIEETLKKPNEYDFAYVLSQMFKDKYVCTNVKSKTWYMFKNHRWILDEGNTLRNLISKDMHDLYQSKQDKEVEKMSRLESTEEAYAECKKHINNISQISLKFKKTTDKNNIMTEAAEIFYDGEFIKNMDGNRYLMCFNNGVLDIKTKVFRPGYPSDYCTKCTNIPYTPFDKIVDEPSYKNEIITFMEQLFPIKELNEYMWQHLASSLVGENVNQYFNIYRGSGSNGKSLLVDLMTIVLGEYKGILPITLITDNRGKVGGTCSELIQLKGCRYAVMQEPKKDMTLNEGIMKEITGEKYMQGRELFQKSEVFAIQFQPVVCTNSLFRVESNDDGTWRRMKIVDFMAKFVDEGEEHTDDTQYVFPKDKCLKDKLPLWAPTFASMLAKIVFDSQGIVKDCDMVVESTMKYRHGQDHISAFIKDNIIKTPEGKIKKTGVWEAFKSWMQQNQGGCKLPKGSDLYEYMDKKFGKYKSDGWRGIALIEPEEENILESI